MKEDEHASSHRRDASLSFPPPPLSPLQVGVGTSTLQLDLVTQAGFKRIINTDYSEVGWHREEGGHKGGPFATQLRSGGRGVFKMYICPFAHLPQLNLCTSPPPLHAGVCAQDGPGACPSSCASAEP